MYHNIGQYYIFLLLVGHGPKCKMQLQYRTIDYYYSLILVGHGPTLLIIGGAMAYVAYAVPTPMALVRFALYN